MNPDVAESGPQGTAPSRTEQRRVDRGKPRLSIERLLLVLALVSLTCGAVMWVLDVERPGRIVERPTVTARGDCYFDGDEQVVVAPYTVTGRNDGEVWLRIRAHVSGLGSSAIVRPDALRGPDGTYEMQAEAEVQLPRVPRQSEALSCRFTAGPWK